MSQSPRIYKPHKYQHYVYRFGLERHRSAWFLDMGLGKTVIALTLADYLVNEVESVKKVLVIAPLRVAENTWSSEAKKWKHTSSLRTSLVLGTQAQRIKALEADADIYIINRENTRWLVEHYDRQDFPFDWIIIDESSSFKNSSSQRWKYLRRVAFKSERITLLTGTPAPNGYMDLWSQIFLIDRGERLGKSKTAYRDRFFEVDPSTIFSGYPKFILRKGAKEKIDSLISDICVSMKSEDYLTLPPVMYNTVYGYFTPKLQQAYKDFKRDRVMEFIDSGLELTADNAQALSMKLLQWCNGSVYITDDVGERSVQHIHDIKLDLLEEIIEGSEGQNILVAYNFQFDADAIEQRFKSYGVRRLKSAEDERDWNDGKIRILLAHPQSGAYGLNLQFGGHIIVWFGVMWNLELYLQFNKRLPRQGQEHTVIIHHLIINGTEDERPLLALSEKDNVQKSLLEALKADIELAKANKL